MKAERATTPSEISRRDLSREVLLTANLDGVLAKGLIAKEEARYKAANKDAM